MSTPEQSCRGREWALACVVALAVLALNAASVIAVLGVLHKPRRVLETDHYYYLAMAQSPDQRAPSPAASVAPFCWRILTPALVHQLTHMGLSVHQAFYLLTNLCLGGFLLALFAYLRRVGFVQSEAWLGVVLVGLTQGAVRWYEYQYWMSDPLALFLVCCGLVLVELRREGVLMPLALIGVLARESFVLVFVYHAVRWLQRAGARGAAVRVLAVAALPLAVLVVLREWLVPAPQPRLLRLVSDTLAFRAQHFFQNQLYSATLGSYGVLLPLALVRPRRAWAQARRHPAAVALVAVTYLTLLVGNNTDRLLAYASPVMVAAGLVGLRALAAGRARRAVIWSSAVVVLQLFYWWSTPFHREAVSVHQPTNWPAVIALLTFWMVAQLIRSPADAASQ